MLKAQSVNIRWMSSDTIFNRNCVILFFLVQDKPKWVTVFPYPIKTLKLNLSSLMEFYKMDFAKIEYEILATQVQPDASTSFI